MTLNDERDIMRFSAHKRMSKSRLNATWLCILMAIFVVLCNVSKTFATGLDKSLCTTWSVSSRVCFHARK